MSRPTPPYPGRPSVDLDGFMSVTNAGCDAIRAGLDQKRALTDDAKLFCAQCKKQENAKTPLQACSRCRSARYCNKTCQQLHYKSTHKQDCATFKYPPLCRAFNYDRLLPGCAFPEMPIFSRGHRNGMGGWVSIAGTVDCRLATSPWGMESLEEMQSRTPTVGNALAMMPGVVDGRFLSLTIMVQNRVQKGTPMVVVGGAIVAVGSEKGTPILMEGKLETEPSVLVDQPNLGRVIGMRAAVKLKNFNGKEIKEGKTVPAMKDPSVCAVLLHPGDYAIFNAEFRCGGPNITLDFQALELIDHINIPSVPFDPAFEGSYEHRLGQAKVCQVLAKIDQKAVAAWYEDYKTKGENAYIASHCGEARANMISAGNETMLQTLRMMVERSFGVNI